MLLDRDFGHKLSMLLQIFLIFSDVLNANVATEIFALREGGNIFFKLVIPFQKQEQIRFLLHSAMFVLSGHELSISGKI